MLESLTPKKHWSSFTGTWIPFSEVSWVENWRFFPCSKIMFAVHPFLFEKGVSERSLQPLSGVKERTYQFSLCFLFPEESVQIHQPVRLVLWSLLLDHLSLVGHRMSLMYSFSSQILSVPCVISSMTLGFRGTSHRDMLFHQNLATSSRIQRAKWPWQLMLSLPISSCTGHKEAPFFKLFTKLECFLLSVLDGAGFHYDYPCFPSFSLSVLLCTNSMLVPGTPLSSQSTR